MKIKALCLILALTFVFLSACTGGEVSEKTSKETDKSTEVTETAVETTAPESDTSSIVNPEEYIEDLPTETVETPHVSFKYYEEWSQYVRFENVTADNGNYEVRCYGVGDIKDFHCFSIIFGEADGLADHYKIGELTQDSVKVSVYTFVNQNFEGLSEEQISIINETVLSYYMNDLSYQLTEVEGFSSARS